MGTRVKRLLFTALAWVLVAVVALSMLQKTHLYKINNISDKELNSKPSVNWKDLQQTRLTLLRDSCSSSGVQRLTNEEIVKQEPFLKRLMYNDEHQIIFCHIPKIASTNWKRVFAVLNGRANTTNLLDIDQAFVQTPSVTFSMTLWNLPPEERLQRLESYKKFFFVRHPFERLLSAFNDKLNGSARPVINNHKRIYGTRILRLYRPNATSELIERGSDATFAEFVRFLTDPEQTDRLADPHWTPMNQLCKPCQINYDYLGKYETLTTDFDEILAENNIQLPFDFPAKESDKGKVSTRSLLYGQMKQLPSKVVAKMYETYQADFDMFGYDFMDWGQKLEK